MPHNMGSCSARELKNNLDDLRSKRVRPNGNYRPYRNHLIINWGHAGDAPCLANPVTGRADVLNHPNLVREATDKLLCFGALHQRGVSVPEFTTNRELASQWLIENLETVLARTRRGSHGRGIRTLNPGGVLEPAEMYVKYKKKRDEYRIHVFNGRIVDAQRKMRATNVPDDMLNWQIRNYDNGFIFGRENVNPPETVVSNALRAVEAVGLDFGAVDVIYNAHYDQAFVLEINTAPGLQGTTLDRYTEAIRSML